MPEPKPIKDGCLQGGNAGGYGGREQIRALIMATRPDEFGPVADAYKATSELLGTAIEVLGDSAARLVADGNWGGESARAMLTRMNRLQVYLQALRGGVDDVPPSLESVSRELVSARQHFDEATQVRRPYAMGTGSPSDPDADARQFMVKLNGAYHQAHALMPDRLPWDAALASPAPYLPPPGATPAPVRSGDVDFENTIPGRSVTALAGTSGYQPSTAHPLPTQADPLVGVIPPAAVPAGPGQIAGTPPPAGQLGPVSATTITTTTAAGRNDAGASQAAAGQPGATGQPTGQPTARPAPTAPPHDLVPTAPGLPVTPDRIGDRGPAVPEAHPSTSRNPYTHTAQESGPSVRPGSVPVVDASWGPRSPVTGGEPGAAAGAGMPFMPMGGMAPQEGEQGSRSATEKSADDDFFRPVTDSGPPVVG